MHVAGTARAFVTLGASITLMTTGVHAQVDISGEILPRTRYFASPFADPVEPRFSIGLLVTDVFAEPGSERPSFQLPDAEKARSEWQAAAAIGGTIPLLRLAEAPEGGIVVGAQAGVFARFRVELPSRDDLGQDWVVAMPIEAAWNRVSARVRISHRSAHLGDEFVVATDADRIEFGGEAFDALTAVQVGRLGRVYAGGAWIFRSYTDDTAFLVRTRTHDRFLIQLGADTQWVLRNDHVIVRAGVDWQTAERTRWQGALALAGGVSFRSDGRSLGLVARYFEGASAMGQFFTTPEQFVSLELVADF